MCYISQARLDELDADIGVDTRWKDGHQCHMPWDCAGDHREINSIGARLALLKNHGAFDKEIEDQADESVHYYHWLGNYQ